MNLLTLAQGLPYAAVFICPAGHVLSPIRGNEHKVGVNFTAGKSLPGRRHLLQCTTYEWEDVEHTSLIFKNVESLSKQGTTGGTHETKMPHVGRSPRVHRSATLGPTVAPRQARDL